MDVTNVFARLVRAPVPSQNWLFATKQLHRPGYYRPFRSPDYHCIILPNRHLSTSALPRIAQPSFWKSIIPRSLRRRQNDSVSASPTPQSRGWNPATAFIILGLFTGSQAIQLIALKREVSGYTHKAEAKIAVLKEVIERVQKGENVDVEGLLGTGDDVKEREWEEVLRELEDQDRQWRLKTKKENESSPTSSGAQQVDKNSQDVASGEEASQIAGSGSEDIAPLKGPPRYL